MKKRTLLLSVLLLSSMVGTSTAKEVKNNTMITTKGHYQKPGAPVNLTHNIARVEVGEVAEINATLSTTLNAGDMEVSVAFDEGLESKEPTGDLLKFTVSEGQKEFPLHFKVSAQSDGLYYIRLLIKVDEESGARMRAMAIPVYVGEGELQKKSNQVIMKAMGGENISVSKAQETIEIIE